MASAKHQRLARLLTECPEVLVALLERLLGLELRGQIEVLQGPETIREGGSHDYLADGTVLLRHRRDPEEAEGLVLEIQLGEDPTKHMRWPLYVAGAQNRLKCPVLLVVVTDSARVAKWASEPIDYGRGRSILWPYVIGPEQIPREIDPQESRKLPALAVLSVVAHGRTEGAERIGRIAMAAVRPLIERGDDLGMLYMDVITAFLDEAVVRTIVEEEMSLATLEPISAFGRQHRNEGRREGRREGKAASLLMVLEARGVDVSRGLKDRIVECRDEAMLERWLRRALADEELDELGSE